jgi:hypothetical protein
MLARHQNNQLRAARALGSTATRCASGSIRWGSILVEIARMVQNSDS